MDIRLKQSPRTSLKLKPRLSARIRLASVLQQPEYRFVEFIKAVENEPLFKKLSSFSDSETRVIRTSHFPGTRWAFAGTQFNEMISRDTSGVDVETLLSEHRDVAVLISGIGSERFEKYFLYGDELSSDEVIAGACGIVVPDVEKIRHFVDTLAVHGEFVGPAAPAPEDRLVMHRIAILEEDEQGEFLIRFFSQRLCAGRYIVDRERLTQLRSDGHLDAGELAGIELLLRKIELINARKSTLYQIIRQLSVRQAAYLHSGTDRLLVPYPQKELAADIGIDDSFVSRSLTGRSVVTPQGQEKPLKFFFPSHKCVRAGIIEGIIEERGDITDREIQGVLRERYGIAVARRTVNACRRRENESKRKDYPENGDQTNGTGR